jgi:hypothetical protein
MAVNIIFINKTGGFELNVLFFFNFIIFIYIYIYNRCSRTQYEYGILEVEIFSTIF